MSAPTKIRFIDGTPVPYSLTVQQPRRGGGWESISAASVLPDVEAWLKINKPGMRVLHTDFAVVYYGADKLRAALEAIVAECERQGETEHNYEICRCARNALGSTT